MSHRLGSQGLVAADGLAPIRGLIIVVIAFAVLVPREVLDFQVFFIRRSPHGNSVFLAN